MLEVTDWAREILERSLAAARRFNAEVTIRLVARDGGVQAALTDGPEDGDEILPVGDAVVFVSPGVSGMLDGMEPHQQLVLRPVGSEPNVKPENC